MKSLAITLLLTGTILLSSCDNCADIACTTPPAPFLFELVDVTSGENLISSSQLNPNDLLLADQLSQRSVKFEIRSDNGRMILFTNDIGWQTEIVDISFSSSGNSLFNFYVDAEDVSEDCCNFTVFNEINVTGAAYSIESSTGIYVISLEL